MPRRSRCAAVTLALALLPAACGGGSNEGDSADDADLPAAPAATTTTTLVDISLRVETFPNLSRLHTQGTVNYPQTPPVGGEHFPVWQNCGFYSTPIQPELGVHSLEHGAVWITFRPELSAADVDRLRALARTSNYVLVSPWVDNSLPAPVVASAWGVQLKAAGATDEGLAAFVAKYAGGPQSPEPGAPCTNGFGTPG